MNKNCVSAESYNALRTLCEAKDNKIVELCQLVHDLEKAVDQLNEENAFLRLVHSDDAFKRMERELDHSKKEIAILHAQLYGAEQENRKLRKLVK